MVKGLQKTKLAIQALNERVRAEQQRTESYKKRGIEVAEKARQVKTQRVKQLVKMIRGQANSNRDIRMYLKHDGINHYTRAHYERMLPEKKKSFFT